MLAWLQHLLCLCQREWRRRELNFDIAWMPSLDSRILDCCVPLVHDFARYLSAVRERERERERERKKEKPDPSPGEKDTADLQERVRPHAQGSSFM